MTPLDIPDEGEARSPAEHEAADFAGASGSAVAEGSGLYRLLVETVRDYAIFALDPTGHILSWNAGAERLKGYRPEEIIGKHFSTFYTPEDLAIEKPRWELEIAVAEGKYEEEGWRVKKDGSLFWANVVITALRGERGELVGFAKVTRDLTERRRAEERALADARRVSAAEAASRTKSEFLAAMSHELRTPINATLGYAELLEMGLAGPLEEKQREFLIRIRGSQEHLLRIVSDLLNYSRIEAGQVEYDVRPVPAHEVVEAVIPLVWPQAAAKRITLDYSPPPEPPVASVDRGKAEQIVLNLLWNAVKFTPEGGRVSLDVSAARDRVLVSVTDTGPGIPLEQRATIFEPFVQLGRSLTSSHEGTGLGLAISRDLARAMGGDVAVESAPGGGATFLLSLPPAPSVPPRGSGGAEKQESGS